ncbi:MAG: HAD family hydrolase [Methanobacteriota archaeon]
MMLLNPHAILFDMDGVLVDSLDSWWYAMNSALKTYNQKEISREEFIKKYWGHDLRDNLKTMNLDPEIGTFCNTIYSAHLNAIKIYPDTQKTLQTLHHYTKGIITNTPRECTKKILKQFAINQYFQVIVTSDEVSYAKPHPEIIIKACQLLNVDPTTVLTIGDTESDVKAGRSAGCTVIGLNIDADIRIQRLSQILDLVA